MKNITLQINAILSDETYVEKCTSFNTICLEAPDYPVEEITHDLSAINSTLQSLIDDGVLDSRPIAQITAIHAQLENLKNHLVHPNVAQQNIQTAIVAILQAIIGQLITFNLYPYEQSKLDYEQKVIEYNDITTKLSKTKKIIEAFIKSKEDIETTLTEINDTFTSIKELKNEIESAITETEATSAEITTFHESSKIYSENIEKNDEKTEALFAEIKKLKETYTASLASATELITTKELSLNEIINTNSSLQGEINELLKSGTAGKLQESFSEGSDNISLTPWFMGIIGTSVALLLLSMVFLSGINFWGIKINSIIGESFSWAATLKIFASLPLIFLEWFLIKEYSSRKNLKDKYRFKAIITTSLIAFNDLVKEYKDNTEVLNFITTSLDEIYKSPFQAENKYSAENLSFIGDIIKKVVPDTTKITTQALKNIK